jgi:hypothetical protein
LNKMVVASAQIGKIQRVAGASGEDPDPNEKLTPRNNKMEEEKGNQGKQEQNLST